MTFLVHFQRKGRCKLIAILLALVIIGFLLQSHLYEEAHIEQCVAPESLPQSQISKTLVVASLAKDDLTWFDTNFLDWGIKRYIVDD
jgi:hypothetical protein